MDASERRRGQRIRVNDEFAAIDEPTTFVRDLSEHGALVLGREQLPIGECIELRFTVMLDDPLSIVAMATVMRHQEDPPGMGVQFGPISPETVRKIREALVFRDAELGVVTARSMEEIDEAARSEADEEEEDATEPGLDASNPSEPEPEPDSAGESTSDDDAEPATATERAAGVGPEDEEHS